MAAKFEIETGLKVARRDLSRIHSNRQRVVPRVKTNGRNTRGFREKLPEDNAERPLC